MTVARDSAFVGSIMATVTMREAFRAGLGPTIADLLKTLNHLGEGIHQEVGAASREVERSLLRADLGGEQRLADIRAEMNRLERRLTAKIDSIKGDLRFAQSQAQVFWFMCTLLIAQGLFTSAMIMVFADK